MTKTPPPEPGGRLPSSPVKMPTPLPKQALQTMQYAAQTVETACKNHPNLTTGVGTSTLGSAGTAGYLRRRR